MIEEEPQPAGDPADPVPPAQPGSSADPEPAAPVEVAPAPPAESDAPADTHAHAEPAPLVEPGSALRSHLLRPRGLLARLALGLVAMLTLLGGPAVAVQRGWGQPAEHSALTVWSPGRAGVRARVPHQPQQAPARSAKPGDQGATRYPVARSKLQAVLTDQAAALLRGDEAAFLASADQSNPALVGELRRRFTALRAMNVAGWTETLAGDLEPVDGGWRASVRLGYCFVVAGCDPVAVPVATRWVEAPDRPRLVEFGSSAGGDLGPRPWEVSDLRVAVGTRVIVAAPPRYAGRVPAVLDAAEEAAAVTDRYARWSRPPGRYLVFLAGADEWGRWYGVHQAQWVAGYAMPITERDTEIVLNAQRVTGDEVGDTLRHEFTHVVGLADVRRDYSGQWWLVEGFAEYVRMVGRPLRDYELLSAARRYVRDGNATKLSTLTEPSASASTENAGGRYGVAFLTARRLAERFGEEKMLRFYDKVVRQGVPAADAARTDFDGDWNEITDDCARYVTRTLS